MNVEWVTFKAHDVKRGRLVAVEGCSDIPFAIARVYYVEQMDGDGARGRHAHRRGEEIVLCLRGTCAVKLDDGRSTGEWLLDSPERGLFIGPLHWEEFRLSPGGLLLALASTAYDPADCIEDYAAFRELVKSDP